ncbi:Ubiquitin-conjugating enzyme E2 [Penicillium chermesinum]|uniref:Ubiquitin-conjugating enzyme E2 n=1 Tax=Penicillium chermesinum TaxID=63820 RepID=A0A9W9PKV6_9EURO|nr:Ubiquitin-conjugating enzyme E2 [Penicillium chermesinum]KAJ5247167.1 Ubiquitin-conjugating enzyme E2 [Penicillium chermesinum]
MVSNLRRLAADHAALYSSKLPPYYLLPQDDSRFSADDLSQLTVMLTGPPGTPYEMGLWRLQLRIPEDYPNSPPKATFRTRIWHPNVEEQTGAVCVDTLKRDWQSRLTLRDVLITISCLLINPNPDSALNSSAGNLLRDDYDEFAHQAKLMTSIHAPITSDLQDAVREAKHRGEDTIPMPKHRDQGSISQRPRKQQRLQSTAQPSVRPRSRIPTPSGHLPQLPRSPPPAPAMPVNEDIMTDSENEDPASASKENNPSLSPSPVNLAPPTVSPRKNAFGKRPLSVLSVAYPEDPDTDMMLVDSDSDGANDSPTEINPNAANIIANIPLQTPSPAPTLLAPTHRSLRTVPKHRVSLPHASAKTFSFMRMSRTAR